MTHICISDLTIIGSDNGLSPGRRQAIIRTNVGILLTGPLGTNFPEILIKIDKFSFKKRHLKISSVKWQPFCFGINELTWHKLWCPTSLYVMTDNISQNPAYHRVHPDLQYHYRIHHITPCQSSFFSQQEHDWLFVYLPPEKGKCYANYSMWGLAGGALVCGRTSWSLTSVEEAPPSCRIKFRLRLKEIMEKWQEGGSGTPHALAHSWEVIRFSFIVTWSIFSQILTTDTP